MRIKEMVADLKRKAIRRVESTAYILSHVVVPWQEFTQGGICWKENQRNSRWVYIMPANLFKRHRKHSGKILCAYARH